MSNVKLANKNRPLQSYSPCIFAGYRWQLPFLYIFSFLGYSLPPPDKMTCQFVGSISWYVREPTFYGILVHILSISIFSLIQEKLPSTLDTMLQSSLKVTSIVHCLYVTWTIIDETLKTMIWFSFICLVFKEGPSPTWSMTKGCQSLLWQMEYT